MIDATGASPEPEYPPVCKFLDAPPAKLPDVTYARLLDAANKTWQHSERGEYGHVTAPDSAVLKLMQHICYLESIIETTGE